MPTQVAKKPKPQPSPLPTPGTESVQDNLPAAKPSNGKSTQPALKKTPAKKEVVETEPAYPVVKIKHYPVDKPFTEKDARVLLDWVVEIGNEFGADYHFKDVLDKKVRCLNNNTNRPIYQAQIDTLKQEILRGRWEINGETIVIGRNKKVLNGQHRLIALVLAVQEWKLHDDRWRDVWKTEPTIDCLIVLGISESDKVVNTLDTGKPRTLADVIYRSELYASMAHKDRKNVARIMDYAVRFLWQRTGAGEEAYAPRRTHAESLDFINRHPKLLKCVKHIYEEDGTEKRIGKIVPPGTAAALLYMMGCCDSETPTKDTDDHDPKFYHTNRTEKSLDWKHWEKAQEFFVLLAAGTDQETKAVKEAIAVVMNDGNQSSEEKVAVVIKAWNLFLVGEGPTDAKELRLKYRKNEEGYAVLDESPSVGGIDVCNAE